MVHYGNLILMPTVYIESTVNCDVELLLAAQKAWKLGIVRVKQPQLCHKNKEQSE